MNVFHLISTILNKTSSSFNYILLAECVHINVNLYFDHTRL